MDTGLSWDTHQNNDNQGRNHRTTFSVLDELVAALKSLPGKGAGAKMIDETTVVVLSEMSRTPLLNADDPETFAS